MNTRGSLFDEFKNTLDKVKAGDKEAAMIVLERESSGENKHAMVGDLTNQITLLEWGIHMIADGCDTDFEKIIELIEYKHKDTDHYMLNVHKSTL